MDSSNINAERSAQLAEAERAVAPYIHALSEKTWSKLNQNERIQTLQKIVDFEATVQEMPAPEFTSKALPNNIRGRYSQATNTIIQNKDFMFALDSQNATKNALHETRHSYQHDCIQHPEAHPNESPKTIADWKKASDNYAKDAQNALTYLANPLEMDARNYAENRFSYYETKMNESVAKTVQANESMNQILVTPDMVQSPQIEASHTSTSTEAGNSISPAVFGADAAASSAAPASSSTGEGHGSGIGR